MLYSLFAACDTPVMASPLYFWTITARLKSFTERLYAISVEDKYPQKVVRGGEIWPVKSHLNTLRKPIKRDWNHNY